MTRVIFYFVLVITSTIHSQVDEKIKVKAAVDTFFEGFHKGDTTLMKSVMLGKFTTQTAYRRDGKDVLITEESSKLIRAVASRPADQKWDERLLNYSIQVDGNMANAWTPYEFWYNDEFSHCGVNSFQLFNDGKHWKIIYLMDTRRRKNCKQ